MHALLVGDLDEAKRAHAAAAAAGYEAGEPDAFAIDHELKGEIARCAGNVTDLNDLAPMFVEFGQREGLDSVAAEGARLWLAAGNLDAAETVLHQLAGSDFGRIPRNVDWLLTVTVLAEVAAGAGARQLCSTAIELLTPYAGRGVSNGGAVIFGGVVDHYLGLAAAAVDNTTAALRWRSSAAAAYDRVGAVWWANRCRATSTTVGANELVFRPAGAGTWQVGRAGQIRTIRDMKGLRYLQLLLMHPNRDLSAAELSAIASGSLGRTPSSRPLPIVDDQALAAYRARLASIDAEFDSADRSDDSARSRQLAAERDALLAELRSATGLGGRTRTSGGTDERARVAVRKAIAAAIRRIVEIDGSLARLLTDTITTGSVCRYEPDPDRPMTWLLS
jgi:hypothetical protein